MTRTAVAKHANDWAKTKKGQSRHRRIARKDRVLPLVNNRTSAKLSSTKSILKLRCLSRADCTARCADRVLSDKSVLIPHETTITDKTPSVHRKQLDIRVGPLHIPCHETHLHAPGRQAPMAGQRAPGHVHCGPDRENGNAPGHNHDARRERPAPCESQRTILFFRRHPSRKPRGLLFKETTQGFAATCSLSPKGTAHLGGNGAEGDMTSEQLHAATRRGCIKTCLNVRKHREKG